jgi:glycine cleavage system aminomethyltransferase T/NADPH-dependent 2,4-dienoyl-CoA reductase/sulfur reductase-like enzyme
MSARGPRRGTRVSAERLSFHFDGLRFEAQRGDTAASALLSNGVRLMGRSVKYRRPRGLLGAGAEEPNALFSVGEQPHLIPNVQATQLVLRDGMRLASQNRWPSLRWDIASLLGVGGGLFSAGFYYKTFIWPSWRSYESMIRRLAGLGAAPQDCALPPVAVEHLACDVLVTGAGAAGLAAALAAARAGARVVVCESEPVCGGELEFEQGQIDGAPATTWLASTLAELQSSGARLLTSTTVVTDNGGEYIAHSEPGGVPGLNTVYHIRPRTMVLAAGALEQPIVFCNNDRPGVMLLGAAERLLACYGAPVGRELVLFANHDRVYAAAQRLAAGGMSVRAIVDTRQLQDITANNAMGAVRDSLIAAGTECLAGHAVIDAEGAHGVRAARVAPLHGNATPRRIRCDAILASGGWSGTLQAGFHGGAATPGGATNRIASLRAGAANGALELGVALDDGYAAGARAARDAGAAGHAGAAPQGVGDAMPRVRAFARSPASRSGEKRQFIDLQNDVTAADLRIALEEGFIDIEHVKRYTTLGIGTEQGRSSAGVGAAVLAEFKGEAPGTVGASRGRPPYQPMTLRSIAGFHVGDAVMLSRRTPLNDWHATHGGVLEPMGLWMRPRYYRANGSNPFDASIAEARQVRSVGGIADGSTLGKLEVAGPDAAAFLDSLYLSKASTIRVGRSKYMVNLREDGMVLDDGLVLRLADDRFLATTGSGHGTHMLSHFEHYRALHWSGHRVTVTDVTEAWAVIVAAGPLSRTALLRALGVSWQPSLARLAHMEFADGVFAGQALRVLRASFSGELAFELHCRPSIAVTLWEALYAAGLAPYGLEAVDILRVEKGYLVGSELNGQATPLDLGLAAFVKQGNACIGSALLDRPAFHEATRPRLVGLRACDGRAQFLGGAQLTREDAPNHPCGYVTSSAYSPTLGQWVGLALVARNLAEGVELTARDPLRGGDALVRVVAPVHFDPSGERMKG